MEEEKNTRGYGRYVALDIHKEYVLAGGMNAEQVWYVLTRRPPYRGFTQERIAYNLREKRGGDGGGCHGVGNLRGNKKTVPNVLHLEPFFF